MKLNRELFKKIGIWCMFFFAVFLLFEVCNGFLYITSNDIIFLFQHQHYQRISILILCLIQNIISSTLFTQLLIQNIKSKIKFCLFLSGIVSTGISSLIFRTEMISNEYTNHHFSLFIAQLCILIFFLVDYLFILELLQKEKLEEEKHLYSLALDNERERIEKANEQYQEMRYIRHDMKHYLSGVQFLIENGNPQEACKLLQDITGERLNFENEFWTQNELIDGVISQKKNKSQQLGISFQISYSGMLPAVNGLDLAIILANLLDNAIEAEERLDEKREICLEMTQINSQFHICIKNRIEESVLEKGLLAQTHKRDKQNHGLGIDSVKKLISSLGGTILFLEEDHWFIVSILF